VLDDDNIGHYLRKQRERISGRWQGPLAVAPGSIVLCLSSGLREDDLITEILVRVLRELHVDARHVSLHDVEAFQQERPPEATPDAVWMVHVVVTDIANEWQAGNAVAMEVRRRLPEATIVAVLLPNLLEAPAQPDIGPHIDRVAKSFEEAAQYAIEKSIQ
jgi:hypothetical protein